MKSRLFVDSGSNKILNAVAILLTQNDLCHRIHGFYCNKPSLLLLLVLLNQQFWVHRSGFSNWKTAVSYSGIASLETLPKQNGRTGPLFLPKRWFLRFYIGSGRISNDWNGIAKLPRHYYCLSPITDNTELQRETSSKRWSRNQLFSIHLGSLMTLMTFFRP